MEKRRVILIRHGKTACEGRCIGKIEIPINTDGKRESMALRNVIPKEGYQIFSSPLIRARETVNLLFPEKHSEFLSEFSEIDAGEWENLSFADIKKHWSQAYQERGNDPWNYPIPGGQSFADVGLQMERGLKYALKKTDEDLMIITHAGAIKSLLYAEKLIREKDLFNLSIPNCSLTSLVSTNAGFQLEYVGFCPHQMLTKQKMQELYGEYQVPEAVQVHMKAVAGYALELGKQLKERGITLDLKLLEKSCLVHDVARTSKNHAAAGAGILREKGYYELAEPVEKHHDLPIEEAGNLGVASILYYADKRILHSKKVLLGERFAAARQKCRSREAVRSWEYRCRVAEKIENNLKSVLEEKEV